MKEILRKEKEDKKMKKTKKSQVSFEFTMSIVIGMMVVLALVAIFANKLHDVMQESKDQQVTALLDILDDEVTFAKGAQVGYARTFELPVTVDGENYSLNLTKGTIAISYLGQDFTRGFFFPLNGSLCLDTLNDSTKEFVVRRSATDITLSSCPDCVPDFYNCSWYDARGSCGVLGTDLEQQCQERYCLCG